MYRKIQDGSVIKLTKYPIVSGDPVSVINYDAEERPILVTYNVISKLGTETIELTYTAQGSPIYRGITYVGSVFDISKAQMLSNPNADPAFQLKQQAREDEKLVQMEEICRELKKFNTYMALITNVEI